VLTTPASAPRHPESEIAPVAYSHNEEGPGQHRFDAHDKWGNNIGYATAQDKPTHVQIRTLYVVPGARGHGIASKLLDIATGYFPGREMRLKPHPFEDERWPGEGGLDEDQLRDFYRSRGFADDQPRADGDWEGWERMVRHPAPDDRLPHRHTGGRESYHGTKASSAQPAGGFRNPQYGAGQIYGSHIEQDATGLPLSGERPQHLHRPAGPTTDPCAGHPQLEAGT
jgi:GNAT superfamily N-acetyltransferase